MCDKAIRAAVDAVFHKASSGDLLDLLASLQMLNGVISDINGRLQQLDGSTVEVIEEGLNSAIRAASTHETGSAQAVLAEAEYIRKRVATLCPRPQVRG
jgi:hypothetical protein